MRTIIECNTTASARAYNTYGSVRTFIIYPGSQVCMYWQIAVQSITQSESLQKGWMKRDGEEGAGG